jgi:hypothetical protein
MQDRQSFKYIYMHLQALHANLLDPGILFSQNLSSPVHSVLINTIGQQTTHKNFNHPAPCRGKLHCSDPDSNRLIPSRSAILFLKIECHTVALSDAPSTDWTVFWTVSDRQTPLRLAPSGWPCPEAGRVPVAAPPPALTSLAAGAGAQVKLTTGTVTIL